MALNKIQLLVALGGLACADYNTVLNGIYDIGNQTQKLTDLYSQATTGVAGVVPALNIQTASLALDNTVIKTTGDANDSDDFGDDGSIAIATAILNLEPIVNQSLTSLQGQRQTLDTYRPIVLAALYQLKEDTDSFSVAVTAKGNDAIKQAGPLVQSQIDGYFTSAINSFLPPTSRPPSEEPDSSKTPATQAQFDDILKFANFAAAAYGDTCSRPALDATVLQYFNNNATDTQATLFCIDSTNELILSFRGTSTAADWTTDLQAGKVPLNVSGASCSDCTVHQGFQAAYNSIQTDVVSSIKAALAQYPGATLTVTGHSLGAAIASIAAVTLAASGITVKQAVTYGEPLNGNLAWANYADSQVSPANYMRVTHANDGVPQIPPRAAGFEHHGTEFWESQNSTASAATTYNCGQNSTDCNASQNFGNSPINAAHLFYGDGLIGNVLHIAACGANPPLAS